MKRGIQSKHRIVNLFIAFAIAWLSLSSILNFHISKIYGKELMGKLEFLKTPSKTSVKKYISFAVDNQLSGILYAGNWNFNICRYHYSIVQFVEHILIIKQVFVLSNSLRGPPGQTPKFLVFS